MSQAPNWRDQIRFWLNETSRVKVFVLLQSVSSFGESGVLLVFFVFFYSLGVKEHVCISHLPSEVAPVLLRGPIP